MRLWTPFSKSMGLNIGIAKQAAKMGFKEVQFDLFVFQKGFENSSDSLSNTRGAYKDNELDDGQATCGAWRGLCWICAWRTTPITESNSVDIFGYAATVQKLQELDKTSAKFLKNVLIILRWFYPSHWGRLILVNCKTRFRNLFKIGQEYMKVGKIN